MRTSWISDERGVDEGGVDEDVGVAIGFGGCLILALILDMLHEFDKLDIRSSY